MVTPPEHTCANPRALAGKNCPACTFVWAYIGEGYLTLPPKDRLGLRALERLTATGSLDEEEERRVFSAAAVERGRRT